MSRILLINPNTSRDVTEKMRQALKPLLPQGMFLATRTARVGARYIACEASYAAAQYAALDAWARDRAAHPGPLHGVLIGCFGDPGLFALRECAAARVTGLAEASFIQAARFGRFGVVTGGERWGPMLQRLAQGLGFADQLAAVKTIALTGAQAATEPDRALDLLDQACQSVARADVAAIIVGGAGLVGMAARLQPRHALPLIDSVQAGLEVLLDDKGPAASRSTDGFHAAWSHMPKAFLHIGAPDPSGRAPNSVGAHANRAAAMASAPARGARQRPSPP